MPLSLPCVSTVCVGAYPLSIHVEHGPNNSGPARRLYLGQRSEILVSYEVPDGTLRLHYTSGPRRRLTCLSCTNKFRDYASEDPLLPTQQVRYCNLGRYFFIALVPGAVVRWATPGHAERPGRDSATNLTSFCPGKRSTKTSPAHVILLSDPQ